MDAAGFDRLARALGRPGSRRRVLHALVGGALAGAALTRRPPLARAGVDCGNGFGCNDGQVCLHDSDGTFRGCCIGVGCPGPDGSYLQGACCSDDAVCCGGVCCGASRVCVEDRRCGDACPADQARCGDRCCAVGQACSDGRCLDACPTGSGARRASRTAGDEPPCVCTGTKCGEVCCEAGRGCDVSGGCEVPCEGGQISCGGTCVLPCGPGLALNAETCACGCVGARCGDACCGVGLECSKEAVPDGQGGFTQHTCCPPGKSCGEACKGDRRTTCCRAGAVDAGGHSCGGGDACCGTTCCDRRKERCVRGRCKRR